MFRSTFLEISLTNLRHNLQLIYQDKPANLKILCVAKDNAYGHGAISVVQEAIQAGASYIAVASIEEALELYEGGIKKTPILIFGETSPENINLCLQKQFTIQIQSAQTAQLISEAAQKKNISAKVHFKVDTGMGRYGIRWNLAFNEFKKIMQLPGIYLEGIMTHFAQSDELKKDYVNLQWQRFESILMALKKENILPPLIHTCNSGGYLDLPHAHGTMVRLGLLQYGVYPSKVCRRLKINGVGLKPVMSLKSILTCIKDLQAGDLVGYGMHFQAPSSMKVGIIPVGYGFGYPRMRNKGCVLIHGQRASILGVISMDAIIVDVTHLPQCQTGDQVVLLGEQGQENITADEIAGWSGSVSYNILVNWSSRLPIIEC